MADPKELALRDTAEESYTGDELPSQGGGFTPTIMPGIHTFQLPANIDQLWSTFDVEKKDAAGNAILIADPNDPAKQIPATDQHLMLKFDRDNPLVHIGGDYDGLPATCTISTLARKRGKGDDAPVVADMTYFVRKCLADKTAVVKRGDWIPIVNKHAGAIIRVESGLSAYCDPERVRYVSDGAGGVVEDPAGTHGCGKGPAPKMRDKGRYYSQDFRVPEQVPNAETGEMVRTGKTVMTDQITCHSCGAALRGFFRIEKYLEPLASTQVVAGQGQAV